MRVPRGGRLLPGCGASGVGRSRNPDCPPSGRAAGAHYPLAVGAGGCERGDPSPTPQRALLRAVGAAQGQPGGGASCLGVGRPGSGALPPPTAHPLGGLPGPTTHWLWVQRGAGVGTRHQPHSARSCELALRAVGAARGRPGGGASCLGVGRPGSGALPLPTARPLGGLPGPTTHWLWLRGGADVGTRHQPHSPCSCVLRGRHESAPGGRSLPGCGASGVGRSPTPDCPPSGRAARASLYVRGGAGVGTRHQPHSARSCVLRGRHESAPGGRLLRGCGASGVGRSPTSDCPPSGRAPGAHCPPAVAAGGCGRGHPSPTSQRALLRAARGGMRVPRGGASCLGVGRPGSGALRPPTARPLGGLPGPTTQSLWVRGGAGVGTRHQPHSARSSELALRAVGAAQGRPGGAPPAWVWGVRGRALSHPRLPALWAGCRGPLPTVCGCGGVRAWRPVTNPDRALLPAGFARCGGGTRAPGKGRLLPGCGASGVGRSPNPDCPPSGRAAGAHYPLAVAAGGCGRGDPSRTPQRALLRAVGAA